jgi:hypothetical protein
MRRRFTVLVAAAAVVTVAACDSTGASSNTSTVHDTAATAVGADSTASSTISPTSTTPTTPTTAPPAGEEASAPELCGRTTSSVSGTVENPALSETSGLVASRRHRGVIWAHNDGDVAGLFALDSDGADLGYHPVTIDGVQDVEDIALFPGPDGDEILLADIGDNDATRTSIRIYRFAEPDPSVVDAIDGVEVLDFVYPDRPHNAEVLLVDETAGRVVIVTKEQQRVDGIPSDLGPTAPSFVFEGPLDGHGNGPVELTAVGTLDAPLLETRTVAPTPHPSSLFGFGGLPTGGDVSPDGRLIAVRTYETVWLWSRPNGSSVAAALSSDPCQVQTATERQGEAIGFLDGTLLTVSEGVNPPLHELRP